MDEEGQEKEMPEVKLENQTATETWEFPEISLHVSSGAVTPQTMRAKGIEGKQTVTVVID